MESISELRGRRTGAVEHSWNERDVRVYALGVGAGAENPSGDDLVFTSPARPTKAGPSVLPSFAVLPGAAARRQLDLGDLPRSSVVHASQEIEILRPLESSGRVSTTCIVTNVWDKGSGALIVTEAVSTDIESAEVAFVNRSMSFVRGVGGFGGKPGPATSTVPPERAVDAVIEYATARDQALLYCLSGDDNPLHWDPDFARIAGFERPILHGLCTYGYAARALVAAAGDGDATAVGSMSARFTAPVFPGQSLAVSIWLGRNEAWFRTSADGLVVLDRGYCTLHTRPGQVVTEVGS